MSALLTVIAVQPLWAASPGAYLGDLTWPEADDRLGEAPIVIVPIAAGAKEHGPHLPMNADQKVLEHLLDTAVASQPVLVAPPILHGWFPSFRDFPGTEVSDPGTFRRYVYLVAESLVRQGAKRIVFLNTGISKATGLPISIAARELRVTYGVPTLVLSWDDLETDEVAEFSEQKEGGHSDEIETSINLVLQPELVHMDRAVTEYAKLPKKDYPGYRPGTFARDPADPAYSETGVFGDATLATVEKGRKTLAIMDRELIRALEGFAQTPLRSQPPE